MKTMSAKQFVSLINAENHDLLMEPVKMSTGCKCTLIHGKFHPVVVGIFQPGQSIYLLKVALNFSQIYPMLF